MTKEEKKAINLLKVLKLSFKEAISYKFTYTLANGNEYTAAALEDMFKIVLNLILRQNTEINKLNNVIDKMVKDIKQINKNLEDEGYYIEPFWLDEEDIKEYFMKGE